MKNSLQGNRVNVLVLIQLCVPALITHRSLEPAAGKQCKQNAQDEENLE